MTPLDHLYGCVKKSDYQRMLVLAKLAHVNLIRVWGGGMIEHDDFYDLCDEHGIMVWQEFIQSSSGICNKPSEKPEFLEKLAASAKAAINRLQNHVSLTYYSGGNELMEPGNIPCTFDNKNLKMLKDIVDSKDGTRLMLPSSPSGPSFGINLEQKGQSHDVHGTWKYEGVIDHYSIYNQSDSLLHSEFGCNGMTNLHLLDTFLSKENQIVTTVIKNHTWRHHGEWWCTFDRDQDIFGEITTLEEFVPISQYIQAEGIRYALEANRRRIGENCGSIIWQMNEPWPNVTSTCIVAYDYSPKLAYYFYKEAMQPTTITMKYDQLVYKKNQNFNGELYILSDHIFGSATVKIMLINAFGDTVDGFSLDIEVNSKVTVIKQLLNYDLSQLGEYFNIEIELSINDYAISRNYLFFIVDDDCKANRKPVLELYHKYME